MASFQHFRLMRLAGAADPFQSMANFGGSGGGGGSTQSSSTAYQTNIPEYAQPYVTSMLNAAQQQLFNVQDGQVTGFAPYVPYSSDPRDYVAKFSPMQRQSFQSAANLQTPGQFGAASTMANQAGQGALGTTGQALGYGSMGSQFGSQGAEIGQGALGYGAMGAGLGVEAAGAGGRYQQMATDPGSIQAYMNPYVQASLAPQLQVMNQQLALQQQKNAAQAVGQGAFGGSRQAVQQGLDQQNADLAKAQLIGQGYNQAFKEAQQAQQFGAGLGLQGLQAGMQGAGLGLQGIQGALAGTAQGMQGAQIGLQGVQGAQAGYGLANQAAGTMGQLGTAQLAAQQAIINQQNQLGAQQQQRQQQIINQAVQDYANAQQYPLMQLGTMSNMLRGLPLQSSTTQQYIAQPNQTTQAIGALGTAGSWYKAMGSKKGGIIDAKKYAKGGIIGYDVGGAVEADLYDMPVERLQKELQSPSQEIRKKAKRIMLEKQIEGKAGGGIIAFAGGTPDPQIIPEQETATDVQYAAPQQAQAPAPSAPVPTTTQGMKSFLAGQAQKQFDIANRPTGEGADERRAYIGPDTAGQDYRKKIMEERANAGDEARRQNWMRAAAFFADWGSRPGNTLAAGMMALKNTIPDAIADQKEQKKYLREIDKTLYELDKAARAERAGDYDKEREYKIKAAEIGWKGTSELSSILRTEEQVRGSITAAGISANRETDMRAVFNERLNLLTNGRPETATPAQRDAAATHAANVVRGFPAEKMEATSREKIESLVKDRMGGKEAAPERNALTIATVSGDPDKIAAAETRYKAKEEQIRKEVTAGIIGNTSTAPKTDTTSRDMVSPTPAGAGSAPPSAAIDQLKANPTKLQKANFDAIFGQGAADRALAK